MALSPAAGGCLAGYLLSSPPHPKPTHFLSESWFQPGPPTRPVCQPSRRGCPWEGAGHLAQLTTATGCQASRQLQEGGGLACSHASGGVGGLEPVLLTLQHPPPGINHVASTDGGYRARAARSSVKPSGLHHSSPLAGLEATCIDYSHSGTPTMTVSVH